MKYLSYKRKEGDGALQEVIEEAKFRENGMDFQIKIVRCPNCHRIASTNPLVLEGYDYHHMVYAHTSNGYGKKMYFVEGLKFPDSEEGLRQAEEHYNSLLLQYNKYKNLSHPKKWPMFKN